MLRWPPTPDTGGRRSGCRRWITTQLGRAARPTRSTGNDTSCRPRWTPAAARCSRCRTAGTGTWPGCGWPRHHGTFTTVAERLKPESLYQRFIAYRESLGFEVLPLSGGERPPFEVLARTAARQPRRLPDGRARPDPHRRAGRLLRRTHPDARRSGEAGDRHRCGAAAGALLVRRATAGVSRSIRRWTRRRATSAPSPRRWPTGSPRNIAAHPPTGTCCSRSGWPTCPSDAARAGSRLMSDPEKDPDAHRDGLPVLVRRAGRGAVARAAAGRGDARRAATTSACWRRRRRTSTLPDYVVSGGKAVPIPYNGSVARLRFGPATHRKVKRWLSEGDFDVLHLHEPNAPSLSMLALKIAEGPIVATFHTSTTKSLTLSVFQGLLRPMHEKIVGRIAVSDLARRWQMEALGTDAVEIPNGVDVASFASAPLLDGYPRPGKIGAVPGPLRRTPQGHGGAARRAAGAGGAVSRHRDPDRRPRRRGRAARGGRANWPGTCASSARSTTPRRRRRCAAPTCTAPRNTGGESFGIVLVEAMAAGTAVVASDLDAFRRVLRDGEAGRLVPVDDAAALAAALIEVLDDDVAAERYVEAATEAVRRYDWSVVASQIMRVYETVAGSGAQGAGGRSGDCAVASDRASVGWSLVVIVARRAGRAARRRVGVPDRQPAGPAARALRPVLAGARRRAGAGARWWRVRSRSTPTADGRRRQAAGGAGRRRRAGAASGPRRPPRTSCPRRWRWSTRRRCRRRWSPSWPTPRRGCCWPAASTTTPSATPWRCANGPRCALLRLGGTAALPTYFEIAERSRTRRHGELRPGQPAHVGARRAARRRRRGAAVLRVRPGDRRRHARRGGGSPSAAQPNRARRWPRPRCANSRRRPGLRVDAGRPDRTGLAARRRHRLQRLGDPQRGDVLRPPHPAVRAVDGRAHRAGAALHPRPPLVRRDDIAELVATGETVYPLQLGELLAGGERAGRRTRCRGPSAAAVDPLRGHRGCGFNGFAATFRLDQ